jgi:hypothetical protein
MKSEQRNCSDDKQKKEAPCPPQFPSELKIYTRLGITIFYDHYLVATELLLKSIPFTAAWHD